MPKPSPVLLCLIETTEIAEDMLDIGLQLHFSHVTWRYDMASSWLAYCLTILLTEYPRAIGGASLDYLALGLALRGASPPGTASCS